VTRGAAASLVLLSASLAVVQCRATAEADDAMAWTLGSWHGVRRSGADGGEAPMTVRVEALPDGTGQVECLRVEGTSEPYVGFALRMRDAKGGWRMVYVNSTGHPFARLECERAGARSVWRSVTPGRTRESHLICEHPTERSWRKTQEISEDGGATWRVLFTDELERDPGGS
jgi:hypothetical protein